jgi:hypothetical protein
VKCGWVYTSAPMKDGKIVSIMQTPERIVAVQTEVGDDNIETMLMMSNYCIRGGDSEVLARND